MKFAKNLPIAVIFFLFSSQTFAQDFCNTANVEDYYVEILDAVKQKKPNAISALPDCFKLDRTLILKAVLIDPTQFQNAPDILQEDPVFVHRLLKISPDILQYASPDLRGNAEFMEKATYISRDALQYANWGLLDNKLFMRRMIRIDSRNYKFASDRLKDIPEFAAMAFADNGLLLEFATPKIQNDRKLVTVALRSNSSALAFAPEKLKQEKSLQILGQSNSSIKSPEDLKQFLTENYVAINRKKNLEKFIANRGKFFGKNRIIERNYITKWQRNLDFERIESDGHVGEDLRLIAADSRNYQTSWRQDFKKYPELIKKIESFFLNHNLAENAIENLSTTYLWKIKDRPLTLAFNLYLLRDSSDIDLGPDFSDITSLTAVAHQNGGKWELSVVKVIFDSEMKVDVGYENGHKKYRLWDLYTVDKNDKNPKLIFKVEDRFRNYFEVFEEQRGGKYQMILQVDVLAKPTTNLLPES